MTVTTTNDPRQYPALRNLQFSPIKEGEEQYMVLWDPTGLSKEKLVLPLNYFFIIQHFDGEHSLAEIGALYLKRFGEFLVPSKIEELVSDLNEKLFLEGRVPRMLAGWRGKPIGRAHSAAQRLPGGRMKQTQRN